MVPGRSQTLTSRASLAPFLAFSAVVDGADAAIRDLAQALAAGRTTDVAVARACFEWVRDRVAHTGDARHEPVTCSASAVLSARTGYCYAKSHLLAALLRANDLAAGFVYQRLALDDDGRAFCLHGLNAVWLEAYGWYRIDARGNRADISARFDPPQETLAFVPSIRGERLIGGVAATPLESVVRTLQTCRTRRDLDAHLPDLDVDDLADATSGVVIPLPA
jgi:transglutaminase-like putative cysteine protease